MKERIKYLNLLILDKQDMIANAPKHLKEQLIEELQNIQAELSLLQTASSYSEVGP